MAIGGGRGMDAGIDLSIMIVVGVSIKGFHFGTTEYLMIGEKITEPIFGEVTPGIIIIFTMVISKETGGLGITPTIGINQSTVSLHIVMMEGRIVLLKRNLEQAIQERLKKVELQLPKESLKKIELQPDTGSQEQVGILLQVLKHILQRKLLKAQVKPLKVNILKKQKERNEV